MLFLSRFKKKRFWCIVVAVAILQLSSLFQNRTALESLLQKLSSSILPKLSFNSESSSPVSELHVKESLSFLLSRKRAYEEAGVGKNWHLRGIAHLYVHRRVLLVGIHEIVDENRQLHRIRIDNVYSSFSSTSEKDTEQAVPSCDSLTMWVRVRGPEILAGKAKVVWEGTYCYWSFEFDAIVPGNYHVDAKVLLWNAYNSKIRSHCPAHKGPIPDSIRKQYPVSAGFKGFKLYFPDNSCCEFCTRQQNPPCRYWTTPPERLADASFYNNGCEFFFDANVTKDQLPFASYILKDLVNVTLPDRRRRRLKETDEYHGYPHQASTSFENQTVAQYFLGCGWHQMFTLDFPCLSGALDDKIYLVQESFSISERNQSSKSLAAITDSTSLSRSTNDIDPRHQPSPSFPLPLCRVEQEIQKGPKALSGRWVKEPWPNSSVCPNAYGTTPGVDNIAVYDGEYPHCWHRDNLENAGLFCAEMNCQFIRESSKWKSNFREKEWMGVWRRYDCDYLEFTDSQLQMCVDKLQIREFVKDGLSVAEMMQKFLSERLKNIRLFNGTGGESEGRTVTYTTMALLHKSVNTEQEFDTFLEELPNHQGSKNVVFFVGPFFLTSEREVFCHVETMVRMDKRIRPALLKKGYQYLSAMDMSAAMSYEVSGQLDGMHIYGPTSKMIIVKMLHYLCNGHVEGSRL